MIFRRIKEEWVVGAIIGVISGYYIFNDALKDYASKNNKIMNNNNNNINVNDKGIK